MRSRRPHVVVLAGPNGAGKTTTAPVLLRGKLGVEEFVNADTIARGLFALAPEGVAIEAGRVMLRRLEQLAAQQRNLAFETTLANRTLAPRMTRCMQVGYGFHLVFLWLPNAELALARVRERVQVGGHNVPEVTVRRRYDRDLINFFELYQSMATTWRVYDNAGARPRLVARGARTERGVVADASLWAKITEVHHGE